MDDVVIVAAFRNGVGKFGGTISKIPARRNGEPEVVARAEGSGMRDEFWQS